MGSIIRLYRVNINQVGILFEGDIDIELRLKVGLMGASVCRIKDTFELHNLGFSENKLNK